MPLLLLTSLVWAFSYGLIKGQLAGIDSTASAMLRLFCALLVFLPFLRIRLIQRRNAWRLAIIGAVQFGLMYVLYQRAYVFLQAHEVVLFTIFTPVYVALLDAAIEASAITHLITVSCTGFGAPGFDLALIANLPLAMDVARTHVGFMGCHGAFNGLRVARAFVEADPSACVLLCAVELCSLHLQEGWNPYHIVANALFADGAGAVVSIAADGAGAGSTHKTGLQLVASTSTVLPGTEELMGWIIEDHGFSMVLSSKVPSRIATQLRPWLEQWLAGLGLTLPEVETWAVHPGGPRILAAVLESAGLQPAQIDLSTAVLRQFGNMSSATILFILERLRTTAGRDGPCLALGFGPGLTVEAALLMVQKPI